MTQSLTTDRLIPLCKWTDFHPYPTVKALRQLVFKSDFNGFEKVIRRVGRKILISEQDFLGWVEEMNEQSKRGK